MENDKRTGFQLRVSNMIATLKFFAQRGVISYNEHFDLWVRLLQIKTDEELSKFVEEVRGLVNKKKPDKGGLF